jgi:hypothetical protein
MCNSQPSSSFQVPPASPPPPQNSAVNQNGGALESAPKGRNPIGRTKPIIRRMPEGASSPASFNSYFSPGSPSMKMVESDAPHTPVGGWGGWLKRKLQNIPSAPHSPKGEGITEEDKKWVSRGRDEQRPVVFTESESRGDVHT